MHTDCSCEYIHVIILEKFDKLYTFVSCLLHVQKRNEQLNIPIQESFLHYVAHAIKIKEINLTCLHWFSVYTQLESILLKQIKNLNFILGKGTNLKLEIKFYFKPNLITRQNSEMNVTIQRSFRNILAAPPPFIALAVGILRFAHLHNAHGQIGWLQCSRLWERQLLNSCNK